MKKIALIAALAIFAACSNVNDSSQESSSSELVSNVVDDIDEITETKEKKAIEKFIANAKESAANVIAFDKSNIAEVLSKSPKYKHVILVVGNHTIVTIEDVEDCKMSSSWSACMPMVKGYIKKGEWVEKEDYANNIIGVPDSQKRLAFFFN